MTEQTFQKALTANDTGESGGHQAGIHIPKSQVDLLRFLPPLDPRVKNPSVWICFTDGDGSEWSFRYVYYNNRLHDSQGTRDEYRITHMTKYFRAVGANCGDLLSFSGFAGRNGYRISVSPIGIEQEAIAQNNGPHRVRLRGWERVH